MRICKPWLLTQSRMDDLICILNIMYKGKTLKVGKKWFQKCRDKGYIDDLDFNLVVTNKSLNPQIPEL